MMANGFSAGWNDRLSAPPVFELTRQFAVEFDADRGFCGYIVIRHLCSPKARAIKPPIAVNLRSAGWGLSEDCSELISELGLYVPPMLHTEPAYRIGTHFSMDRRH